MYAAVLLLRGPSAAQEILASPSAESEAAKFGRDHREVRVDFRAGTRPAVRLRPRVRRIGHQAH